jgi:aminoglycoside 6-adenylyltransferase
MRSEDEVLDQLLAMANENNAIRAVILNGSRVNPNSQKDILCDYDIVFAVTETEDFKNNRDWIDNLGELVILQQNDMKTGGIQWYIFLLLFKDGVRIDLSFFPAKSIRVQIETEGSLRRVLLDKDKRLDSAYKADDSSHFIKKPTEKQFYAAINEFWWCSTNVAKGLWRNQLPYTKFMQEVVVRDAMNKMINWYIGMTFDWKINPGAFGKWFKKYLSPELWDIVSNTYPGVSSADIWNSLFESGRLIRMIGSELAKHLGCKYPIEEDKRVTEYLKRLRNLPESATSFDGK